MNKLINALNCALGSACNIPVERVLRTLVRQEPLSKSHSVCLWEISVNESMRVSAALIWSVITMFLCPEL